MKSSELLGKKIASHLLEGPVVKETIAIYAGRFQPFHPGHYSIYKMLVKKFGAKNTYIATTNKVDAERSPMNFKEKKMVISRLFDIPEAHIVQVKSPYSPTEILSKYDEGTTAFVTAISAKDVARFRGNKYFDEWTDNPEPYEYKGYYILAPVAGGRGMSGTEIREMFRSYPEEALARAFKKLYGKFDQKVFDLLQSKFHVANDPVTVEEIESLVTSGRYLELLSEINTIDGTNAHVDDGPGSFLPSGDAFKHVSSERARQIGYTVMDYIMNGTIYDEYAIYPHGPVDAVSFFPAGDYGKLTAMNQEDIYGVEAYDKWFAHVTRAAMLTGYELVHDRVQKQIDYIVKKQSTDMAKSSKKLKDRDTLHEWLLKEGGGMGHINHPFEDMTLTFGDMKDIITRSLSGNLDMVQEKLDGQNLMITFHNGKVKAARNKTQLKGFGSNAMDIAGVSMKFSGRGNIEDAFVLSMMDLENAISKLSSAQQEKIFMNGKRYVNLEILYPQTANVIPYGLNMVVFHGVVEVDEDGNHLSADKSGAKVLSGMIKQINQDVQKTFTLTHNPTISLPKVKNMKTEKSRLLSKLKKLQSEFGLKDSDQVLEYHLKKWESLILAEAKKRKYEVPWNVLNGLLDRWARQNKSAFSVNDMKSKIDHESFLEWVKKYDQESHASQFKKHVQPFEALFLELGKVVLSGVLNLLMVQDTKGSTKNIQSSIESTIRDLEKTDDLSVMKKVEADIAKLDALGGIESILPTEGIVFMYGDKLFKLTGAFAPVNQILGQLKFA